MTAPLFLLDEGRLANVLAGQLVALEGAEGRHAATVKRLAPGEQVLLADGSGTVADGVVVAAGNDRLDVRVEAVGDASPGLPHVTLVQALAKGDRDDQAIEAATELGVDVVVPWQAERSIVQWKGERGAKAARKWEQVVRAAAKQSRRATVPTVAPLLARGGLTQLCSDATVLVLHEDAETSISSIEVGAEPVVLVVGPEGGITPTELDLLTAAGAHTVRLGPHVLRSSSAGPAALAVVMSRTRWAR
ncbi:16S rRNA (uracil(1498)-N(3))-methyltransferase [Calidifontibacter terrae]